MSLPSTKPRVRTLNVLVIGSGAIGSLYGGLMALAGHKVWFLAHKKSKPASHSITLFDTITGKSSKASVELAQTVGDRLYDLVIVAVQVSQLESTFPTIRQLKDSPHIVFFGNNPDGHTAIPSDLPGSTELGFPGVSCSVEGDTVKYIQIAGQPTMLEDSAPGASSVLQTALESQGFSVSRTANMDGWLAYHAVFISCILKALQAVKADAKQLGRNNERLRLMCRAISEGFGALKAQNIRGLPRNLAILHSWPLRAVAVQYWGRIMRSSKGELYFAKHLRRAPAEAEALANWVIKHVVQDRPNTSHIKRLLGRSNTA